MQKSTLTNGESWGSEFESFCVVSGCSPYWVSPDPETLTLKTETSRKIKESVKILIILIFNFRNHQSHSEGNIWRQQSQNGASQGRMCDVHRSELTSEPPCEARTMKRQRECRDRDISREKYGKVQRRKDGFNSVYKLWPFYTFEKMWVTPKRAALRLQDTHDWCTKLSSLQWALKFMGCSVDLQFYFPSPKWNQGIEDRQRSPAICCDRHTCPSYGL